jgi:2,3-bisphosphoglycerate-independent phosphoglycerate mutase
MGHSALAGLKTPMVVGATGDLDTNYKGKVEAVLSALAAGDDFAVLHVEAPDEMSHAGDLQKKLEAIRRLDLRVIAPLLTRLPALGDFRLLMLSDHLTLLSTRGHDGSPVPWALYDSRHPGKAGRLDEETAAKGLYLKDGTQIMAHLFEQE